LTPIQSKTYQLAVGQLNRTLTILRCFGSGSSHRCGTLHKFNKLIYHRVPVLVCVKMIGLAPYARKSNLVVISTGSGLKLGD